MTNAICVKCGAMKYGAFGRCGSCGQGPESEIDLAYSFALTDHYLSASQLEEYSAWMLAGNPPPLMSPEQEEQFKEKIQSGGKQLQKVLSLQRERIRRQQEN